MTTNSGFFGPASLAPAVDPNAEGIDLFARAIAGRFNNSDKALLTARLSATPVPTPSTPFHSSSQPSPAMSPSRMPIGRSSSPHQPVIPSSSASTSDFTVVTASTLSAILRTPHVLVLDIRPHSAYSTARLPHAISLSVPSTLLKRPAFTLQKLAAMLPSATARSRFQSWSKASRILAYDADSSTLADGSNLLGLLRKFRAAGFLGDVAWLHGGIQSLWRDNRHLVDENSLSDDEEEGETPQVLRARNLPQAAFQQSTTILRSSPNAMTIPSDSLPQVPQSTQSNSGSSVRLTAANPFYDNIRQNMELSHGITERIPLRLSPTIASRAGELPFAWLRNIAASAGQDEGTEALAMQFYRIELGEQRRLQGIMAHHSMQSGTADVLKTDEAANEIRQDDMPFPFSIVAGVEKGTKNRYRNIWPFEHSRVRLRGQEHDDYVNASFVQPLGTRRKFIATQGPLPSTFSDFWSVVWEQDVHIILMLTRECEGGSIKCGKYWADGQYGPYRLRCVTTSGAKEEEDPGGSGMEGSGNGFFNAHPRDESDVSPAEDEENNFTIRRIFELSHSAHPGSEIRTVTQLQYLGWPDMDVPVNPRSLLRLMFDVDDLIDRGHSNGLPENTSPVLLHCSAGVGRTGAFIMIDAVLDGVRREIRKRVISKEGLLFSGGASEIGSSGSDCEAQSESDNAMDIDSTSSIRNRCISSIPTSTSIPSVPSKSTSIPPTPQPLPNPRDVETPLVTQTQTGPVATLQMGGNKSGRPDIHIPLVPSNEVPVQRLILSSSSTSSSPSVGSSNHPSSHMNPLFKRRLFRPFVPRPLTSDFTIADADSMFMSPSPNPAFAMDVESVQPLSQQAMNHSSSSGEGNASSGDRASGSVSSGSASDGRFTGPLQKAFANMSSADDVPGPTECLESGRFRSRFGSGDGEGAGGSASESSAKYSNAGGSNGGGYSSTSSLGLSRFAGMAVTSPAPTPGYSSPIYPRMPVPLAKPPHRSPRKLPMQKPSLLSPKPLHLQLSMPELTEGVEATIRSTPGSLPRLKETRGSNALVRSNMSSTSSVFSSSTDTYSSLRSSTFSGHTTDTYDTPLSTHRPSRSPSAEKETGKMSDQNVFDYASPRLLHSVDSPPLLSTLEEPLRQILEDMREQRMSLCQSLRQYVFVHNAIIEGALIIADRERKRLGLEGVELLDLDAQILSTDSPRTQTTGKRGASPTELTKKDMKGEVALTKRPSVKRGKSTSGGESASPI